MELVLKIDDKELESAIMTDLRSLSPEQVSEVTLKAMETYLSDPRVMERLIFQQSSYSYDRNKPTELIVNMLMKYDGQTLSDFQNLIIDYFKEHYPDILLDAMKLAFSKQLMSYEFSKNLDQALAIMDARLNQMEKKMGMNN